MRQHEQGAKPRSARDHKRLKISLDGGGHHDVSVYISVQTRLKVTLSWAGPVIALGRPLSVL
jgi:hypothetical protein